MERAGNGAYTNGRDNSNGAYTQAHNTANLLDSRKDSEPSYKFSNYNEKTETGTVTTSVNGKEIDTHKNIKLQKNK